MTDPNIINALIFSSITNNIDINDKKFNKLISAAQITTTSTDEKINKINEIFNYTTIKRACCMAKNSGQANMTSDKLKYKVDVKIPLPANYSNPNEFEKKF